VYRLILALILLVAGAQPLQADVSGKWIGWMAGNTAAARYGQPSGGATANATEGPAQVPLPVAVTVTKLSAFVTAAPDTGAGTQTWTITLREDDDNTGANAAANTAATCTISEAETSCSWSGSEAIAASAFLAVAVTPASTPTAADVSWVIEYTHATKVITFFRSAGNLSNTASANANIIPIQGDGSAHPSTDATSQSLMPLSGNLTDLCVYLATAAGAGVTRTFTARVNGTNDTTLEVAFADPATGVSCDSTGTIAVTAGTSRVNINHAVTGGTGTSSLAAFGVAIDPTTDGQFPIISTANGNAPTASTTFIPVSGAVYTPNATEGTFQIQASNNFVIQQCYAYATVATGAGATWTVELRENTADASSPFTITIDNASQSSSSSSGSFTPASGGLLAGEVVPSAGTAPASARVHWSCQGYIAPPAGTAPTPDTLPLLGVGSRPGE
jgi:hypothetical protein